MPVQVACPKCKTKYNLPDEVLGKRVQCRSCKAAFRTPAPAGGASQVHDAIRQQPAQGTSQGVAKTAQTNANDFASLGIDGPIRRQADIFAGTAPNPQGNPLGNSVVEDPGFADIELARQEVEEEGPDDGMGSILNNPYATKPKKKKKRTPMPDDGSGKNRKKKRRKKNKLHPAAKDSLNKATMILLVIGSLIMMWYGFQFFSAQHDADAIVANSALDEVEFDDFDTEEAAEETANFIALAIKIIAGFGLAVGAVFILLGFGVQLFPVTCIILALIFFVLLEVVGLIINPWELISLWGWGRRIIICGALGAALMDAMNARYHQKAMEARGRA